MAEDKPSGEQAKSIEMRLAAIEDKLSKMQVTEEEMKAFHKVSALMAGSDPAAMSQIPQLSPQIGTIGRRFNCWPIIPRIFCFECICGPCNQGGGGFGGGGFGGFGQ